MNFIHAHLYVKQYVENNVRQCEEQDTEVERLVQFGYLDNEPNSDAIRQKTNARYNQSTDVEKTIETSLDWWGKTPAVRLILADIICWHRRSSNNVRVDLSVISKMSKLSQLPKSRKQSIRLLVLFDEIVLLGMENWGMGIFSRGPMPIPLDPIWGNNPVAVIRDWQQKKIQKRCTLYSAKQKYVFCTVDKCLYWLVSC